MKRHPASIGNLFVKSGIIASSETTPDSKAENKRINILD